MVDLLDKMTEHRFGYLEICDDAIFHGPNGHNVSGGASQHSFGFFANRQDVVRACLDRDDRRFTQNYPPITHVYEGIGRPEIYSNIVGKQAFKLREHELRLTGVES